MKVTFCFINLLPLVLSSPVDQAASDAEIIPGQGRVIFEGQRDIPAAAKSRPSSISPGLSSPQPDDTLDYKPVWRGCPEDYLVCEKCPFDFRCLPPIYKPTPNPKAGFPANANSRPASKHGPKRPRPNFILSDPSEPAALTGPQLANYNLFGDDDTDQTCALKRCDEGRADCHSSTTCVRGYCRCQSDLKAASGGMARGWKYPESATVYVDAGTACEIACQRQFCAEIPKTSGCFEDEAGAAAMDQAGKTEGVTTVEPSQNDGSLPVAVANEGHGAIQIPGADVGGAGSNPVAGIAAGGVKI